MDPREPTRRSVSAIGACRDDVGATPSIAGGEAHRVRATLSYPLPVPQHISIEELEAAMAAGIDEDGNDIRLAEAVAAMTPEQRRRSEENLRRWAEKAQNSLRSKRAASDDV